MLEVLPIASEIKEAIWACDPSKAPSSDGFNLDFVRQMWETIRVDFKNLIVDFFQSGCIPKKLNMTWVTFILKFEGLKT